MLFEVVYLSIVELWKHKQNNAFQSYRDNRIKEVIAEVLLWSWMIGCGNKAIKYRGFIIASGA